jgi:DNA helicase HerA-like ATPase
MRTIPKTRLKENSDKLTEARIQKISRKVAISFILLIQLAIIYKMLL